MATAGVQQTLKDALDEVLRLIEYCCRKVAERDNVHKNISNCIMDLMFKISVNKAQRPQTDKIYRL